MTRLMPELRQALLRTLLTAPLVAASGAGLHAQDASASGVDVRSLAEERLTEAPGKQLTAVVVDFAPGAVSAPHRHAGLVFAYVLSGAVRSQLAGGAAAVYRAGDHFVEPPGSEHVVAENVSRTEPARLLVVFVADEDAALTRYDR